MVALPLMKERIGEDYAEMPGMSQDAMEKQGEIEQ
jgi:hypothetical protein